MKKKMVILTLVLLAIVTVSGCGSKEGTEAIAGSAVSSVCNAPYFEYKAGDCCLDSNSNNICDSDEDVAEAAPEEVPEETAVAVSASATEVEEVEITVQDSCTDTTYFECKASYITNDEIFLKLETRRDGYTHLNKISALGCEREFVDKAKSSEGYPIRSDVIVSIPCLKNSPGNEIVDADVVMDYTFYPVTGIADDTGEWEGKPRNPQRSTGKISGTVRNEPKKIL
jgi:hypothetical protein